MKHLILTIFAALLLSTASAQPLPPPMSPLEIAGLVQDAQQQGSVRVIVKFTVPGMTRSGDSGTDEAAIKAFRLGLLPRTRGASAQFVADSESWTIPYAAMQVDAAALQAIASTPGVLAISEDTREYRQLESALPLVNVDDAHTRGTGSGYPGLTGVGWTVVVIDDGIQLSHPFFGGRIVNGACFSSTYPFSVDFGSRSLCPNGSMKQFGLAAADTAVCGALCSHGTHVAGIAAGKNADRSGVAPGANIVAINVFSQEVDSNNTPIANSNAIFTFVSDQIGALQRVKNFFTKKYKIAAVNMSLGAVLFAPGTCESFPGEADQQARLDAINALTGMNIAVVISSGNNSSKTQTTRPGCITNAVTVSSVDDNLAVSSFSNVSTSVDFFAPGANITSAGFGSTFFTQSGTSMAAPFVTGAIAVLRQAAPNASLNDILAALAFSGTPITDVRAGAPGTTTKPLIQIDNAIDLLRSNGDEVSNGDMEAISSPGTPDGWKRAGNAKAVCGTPPKVVYDDCAAVITATASASATLSQNILSPEGINGDTLTVIANARAAKAQKAKIILRVTYANGTTKKVQIPINGTFAWATDNVSAPPLLLADTVQGLLLRITVPVGGGKIFVDNVRVILTKTLVEVP